MSNSFSAFQYSPGTLTENDRTGPTRGWGGTAILIKRSIPHFHVPTPPLTGVEATLVALTPQIRTFLGCLYLCPTRSQLQKLGSRPRRPISLLPVLSKLAEKVILARLNDHLERENILIPEQHGFRPRLSTSHQLLRVVEFIKEGNNKDECTAAVFLDIQKAFDRVWHTGLLFKLITYKIPPPLIYLLNSYISDRSFTVKINRTFSQLKKINAGVAQGSILAPTLFNLYVNDIIKNSNTIICMYADDTAILSRHRNLDTLVENINEHL
ncbi:RNA-directed DNA polymerase from mobile element jockey [Trichonephila clavipes]|nr:RNA-directed DNA polymerase from mobile element jockey [Trichonephila clavipes]